MSTKVANLTGYITDYEGKGFAADSERMRNISFDTKIFGKNKKVTMQPGPLCIKRRTGSRKDSISTSDVQ